MIPYRIALITDLHIDDLEKMSFDIDSKNNFLLMLQDINRNKIRHIIITGDLCNTTPKISIYKWIKEQLDNFDFSYNIIPGNHDSTQMIQEVFFMDNLFYSKNEWGRKVIFLDTSNNNLSREQQFFLESELGMDNKECIIFMHHPPTLLNFNFMDQNYPIVNLEEVQEVLQKTKKQLTIFCGHYHTDIEYNYKNQKIIVTPSNVFQIDGDKKDFKIKSYNPGWRYIDFDKNKIITNVNYIDIKRGH